MDLQLDALRAAGCEHLFTHIASGAKAERQGLTEALVYLRPGDTLVVWKLDHLGRSLRHLIEILTALHERGVGFRSMQESIDTTTSGGKLIFHVFGALAEFERDLIRERTRAGLTATRVRGTAASATRTCSHEEALHQRGPTAPHARRAEVWGEGTTACASDSKPSGPGTRT